MNTFFGVCPNPRISSYVGNIFTETPNQKFDVLVNIFPTYEEIEPIRFGSKIERQSLKKKNRDIVQKKNPENLNTFFGDCPNPRISSYVGNIFTETPNQKFDVLVNIFPTYEEIEPIRFGSKIERQSLTKKNRDIVQKKKRDFKSDIVGLF